MVNDSTEGTEDGPTETVLTEDSSVDTEEDGETLGVLGGIPPVANKAFEQPVQPSEPSVKAQQPQKPAAAPVTEMHKKVNNAANASFSEKKEEKKTGLFIGIASAMMDGMNGLLARKHSLGNKESGLSVPVGDIITFGRYEQDDISSNGKKTIKWIVLAKEDNRILIISKYALDCRPYNNEWMDVTWGSCTLRTWLNDFFYNDAFNPTEKTRIRQTKLKNDGGNDTEDRVFLLSISEAESYFNSNGARMCTPTDYAKKRGAPSTYEYTKGGRDIGYWWLRSPRTQNTRFYKAANVRRDGSINYNGTRVDSNLLGVRPAMWINLGS